MKCMLGNCSILKPIVGSLKTETKVGNSFWYIFLLFQKDKNGIHFLFLGVHFSEKVFFKANPQFATYLVIVVQT